MCHVAIVLYSDYQITVRSYNPSSLSLLGDIVFKIVDLGGHRTACRALKDYYPAVDAIVFMINANDKACARFEESRVELAGLLAEDQVADAPVLVLGNQTDDTPGFYNILDTPGAASEEEIRQVFGLQDVTTGKGHVPKKNLQCRPVELFMWSVPKREGLDDGFNWLAQYLN